MLTSIISKEGGEGGELGCDGDKSPGSHDFNFNFIKNSWEVVKYYIVNFLQEFQNCLVLLKGITALFLL